MGQIPRSTERILVYCNLPLAFSASEALPQNAVSGTIQIFTTTVITHSNRYIHTELLLTYELKTKQPSVTS